MSISEAARRRPFLRLNAIDFFGDDEVEALTPQQQGRYLRAMLKSWLTDEPGVAESLQWGRWMGYDPGEWEAVAVVFAPCFKVEGVVWVQSRLVEEYRLATRKSRQAMDAAAMRWQCGRNADASHDREVPMREGRGERGDEASSEASRVLGSDSQLKASYARAREEGQNGRQGGEEGGAGGGELGDLGRQELGAGAPEAGVAGAGGQDGQGRGPAGTGRGDADLAEPAAGPARGRRPGSRAGDPGAADAARARREWEAAHAEFYAAYPRKVGPSESLKAWLKIEPKTQAMFDLIDLGLVRHTAAWKAEGREKTKIPHPATWLNKRRWEGEA